MCGIFRSGSRGLIAATSPPIQFKPATTSCSRPRVASNCAPTQIPRNGRPTLQRRLLHRLDHAGDAVESAPAVGEGADPRQNDAVRGEHILGTRRDLDLIARAGFARGALERLPRRVEVARAVVDDCDAHLHAQR